MKLKVQDLTKLYNTQRAIDQISFEVGKGEIVGFLGPNGAGKTTTMKIITCFMPPTSGTVTLGDFNISDHSLEVRKQIGYLPEHNPLYLDMFVHDFLRFVGRLYHSELNTELLNRKALKDRVQEVINLTGLEREQHKMIGQLSKGYRQRVGLAQALLHDPPVLILDEPTTGLDPNQLIEVRELIKNIGKEKTIIFSTHILSEVEAIADRVIIINRGKIVANENMITLRKTANQENVLMVEFENPGFQFDQIREGGKLTGLQEIGNNKYQLSSPSGIDVRRTIFEESVRQNNPIFSLMKVEKSLEDIFRNLTR